MEALNTVAEFAYENPLATLVAAGAGYLAVSAMMTSDPRQRPSASAPKKDQPKPKKGHGPIIRNKDYFDKELTTAPQPDLETCYHTFHYAVKKYGDKPCVGTRKLIKTHFGKKVVNGVSRDWEYPELGPYEFTSYNQLAERAENFASGLIALGMKPRDFLAVHEETRLEWTITARSCFNQSIALYTVYANLGHDALVYALKLGNITHMMANGSSAGTLAGVKAEVPSLKYVIYTDDVSAADKKKCADAGLELVSFEECEKLGKKKPAKHTVPKKDDLACIMFTSGSTGVPKGVMITHSNFTSFLSGVDQYIDFDPYTDKVLHYLPLAHSLAFMLETTLLYCGVPMYYGSPRTISSIGVHNCDGDLKECRPTLFVAVPTILEKVKHAVTAKVQAKSAVVQALFSFAFERKLSAFYAGTTAPLWDKLVFAKIRKEIGMDRVRYMLTGSAPLSGTIHDWIRVVIGAPLVNGYGLTETCSAGTYQVKEDVETMQVGVPSSCTEVKLVSAPDMGYLVENSPPAGEIWIRGPTITKGYYKQEAKTAEDFQKDADSDYPWFKTGDIATYLPNGNFKIVDRKKNLIKPPHGEYIAIEKVEAAYKNCRWLSFLMCYVDGYHSDIVMVAVPNGPFLQEWAAAQNHPLKDDLAALCKDKTVLKFIMDELKKTSAEQKLRSIETVRAVYLTPNEWTPDNSMLTAAMKLNRTVVVKEFQEQIDAMYDQLASRQ